MTKSESKTSIQCDKCHKWIKYNDHFGYSHYCSRRTEETCRAVHGRLYFVRFLRNLGAQILMYEYIKDKERENIENGIQN